jgi:uncharacterized protein (DUF4415 family)
MTGSKTTLMTRKAVLAAVKTPPVGGDFVWDGKDEDERPLTPAQMQVGINAYRKQRGRPAGSGTKEQVAIRFDRDVLSAFRTAGPGWQTRMNDALKDWLRTHSAV